MVPNDVEAIRARIRKRAGDLSAYAIAKRVGHHPQSVRRWLTTRKPSLQFLYDFANEFDAPLGWLVEGKFPDDPTEAKQRIELDITRWGEVAGGRILPAAHEDLPVEAPADSRAAREIETLYGPDAPKDLNALFEAQMGVMKRIQEMGPEGSEFAKLMLTFYKMKIAEPEKYKGLLKLLDMEGQFDLPVQLQHLSKLEVLSPEEYRARVGELEGPESYTAIPLVADPVAAGAGTVIDAENIEGFAVIYSGWVPPGRVTCVRVTGDSMIPTLRPDSLIAVHHDDKAVRDGSLYCLFDRTADGAIVKRVRTTNIEGEFLVESDNPDKRRHPTMIWKADGDGDAQGFALIGRVIWGWTLF